MADDLFVWLDALWNKKQPEGAFPAYVAHRFLAADRDLAQAARLFALEIREPDLIFRTWQGALPKGRGAPRGLQYVAAKKPPAEEALVERLRVVLSVRRPVAEEMVAIVRAAGREDELYQEFGVVRESEEEA